MEEGACEIVLEGADQGTPTIEPKPPGPISYALFSYLVQVIPRRTGGNGPVKGKRC